MRFERLNISDGRNCILNYFFAIRVCMREAQKNKTNAEKKKNALHEE
jgi:hypothetical protein